MRNYVSTLLARFNFQPSKRDNIYKVENSSYEIEYILSCNIINISKSFSWFNVDSYIVFKTSTWTAIN